MAIEKDIGVQNDIGIVRISDEVISTVSSVAIKEIKGVVGMSHSFAGGIAEMLGKKSTSRGVKAEVKNNSVIIDVSIVIEYGVSIPDVAWEIQEKIKNAVEAITGLSVENVNILVQGIEFKKEEETQNQGEDQE